MPLDLRRFVPARWTSFILRLTTLCALMFVDRSGQNASSHFSTTLEQHDEKTNEPINHVDEDAASARVSQDTPDRFPITEGQLEKKIAEFIASIDKDAVCRLASRHNGQKPCRVLGQGNGSFNVCFFVYFDADDMTWVVRIPIEPVVHNVWDKVQSEVATMRYIEHNTKIPVPHVHAYGEHAELMKGGYTTQAFLILDYISGQSLDITTLVNATKEQRNQFYDDFVDILAQLRTLEFPTAGSLMPNPDNELEPIVGGLLSMANNELQRCRREQGDLKAFTSAEHFTEYQCHILAETYRLPTEDLSRKQAELELFALDSLAKQIPKMINSRWSNGPFVLTHLDLRCGNIIVTEDLHIHGIIDWEFTGTIPRQLFTLPPWITGHDLDAANRIPYGITDLIYSGFYEVLQAKSKISSICAQLERDWQYQQELTLPIAQILRHPSSLIRVYYRFIFRQLFEGHRDQVVPELFRRDENKGTLALEVERRIEESKRYTQYLEDRGLLVIDEESQEIQEVLAKVEQARNR